MSSTRSRATAVVVVAATIALIYAAVRSCSTESPGGEASDKQSEQEGIGSSSESGANDPQGASSRTRRDREPSPDFNQAEFNQWQKNFFKSSIGPDTLDRYLEQNNRSASSIAFVLTVEWRDSLWHELKRHKDSPVAAKYILSYSGVEPSQRLQWAKRLKDLEPDNLLGPLAEGAALSSLGRDNDALKAFEEALNRDKIDLGIEDLIGQFNSIEELAGKQTTDIQYLKTTVGLIQPYETIGEALAQFPLSKSEDVELFQNIMDKVVEKDNNLNYFGSLISPVYVSSRTKFSRLSDEIKSSPEFVGLTDRLEKHATEHSRNMMRTQSFLKTLSEDQDELGEFASRYRRLGWSDSIIQETDG